MVYDAANSTQLVERNREGGRKATRSRRRDEDGVEERGLQVEEGRRRSEDSRVDRTQYCNNFNYADTTDHRGVNGSADPRADAPRPTPSSSSHPILSFHPFV